MAVLRLVGRHGERPARRVRRAFVRALRCRRRRSTVGRSGTAAWTTRSSPAPKPGSLSQCGSCRRCRQRWLPLQPLRVEARFGGPSGQPTDHLRGRAYAQNNTPKTMPTGIAATRTAPQRERRSRTAVGATAGRSHRAGTNRSAGHRRRAQTTIRPASRLSIAALSPLCIARGYVRAASAANAADRHPPRSFPRATSLLLRATTGSAPATPLVLARHGKEQRSAPL